MMDFHGYELRCYATNQVFFFFAGLLVHNGLSQAKLKCFILIHMDYVFIILRYLRSLDKYDVF